jgi:hypothetical protein
MVEKAMELLLVIGAIVYSVVRFGLSWKVWQEHLWEIIAPLVWAISVVIIYHSIRSALDTVARIQAETSAAATDQEGHIERPTGGKFHIPKPAIPPPRYFRLKIWSGASVLIAMACFCSSVVWIIARIAAPITVTTRTQARAAISIYLGCDWDHIPIHIPASSTIHVIRLNPGILSGNPRIRSLGVFENVSSRADASLDFPSKSEGRWM